LIVTNIDVPGIIAQVSKILSAFAINIAFMRVSRQKRGQLASMIIETDHKVSAAAIAEVISLPQVESVRVVGKV
jgi:L-serine dehydratase